jgi:hypothetical protein
VVIQNAFRRDRGEGVGRGPSSRECEFDKGYGETWLSARARWVFSRGGNEYLILFIEEAGLDAGKLKLQTPNRKHQSWRLQVERI